MKFSVAAIFGAVSVALLAPKAAQACERLCMQNVSHAFADKYEYLSNEYFQHMDESVEDTLLWSLPQDAYTKAEGEAAITTVKTALDEARKAWVGQIYSHVFTSIFTDEPKFKGDCNHPKRVQQPPLGVYWKMEDCHNMDYICGNPPSICHFMPMIKKRIREKFIRMFQEKVDGDEADMYSNFLGPALDKIITDNEKFSQYKPHIHANVNAILASVKDTFNEFADDEKWKREWDDEIKESLLTFP